MPINSFVDYPMSWRPERRELERPVYLSLARMLERDITEGFLPPGTKLPPQRELADFLDINFTTVTRAYKTCELKGLLHAVTGSGTFVSTNAVRSVTISRDRVPVECIDFGLVASFEQSNFMVTEAVRKVSARAGLEQFLNYDNPDGIPHQKEAALRWMRPLGITANADQVAIVSGAQNALTVTLLALFEPGSRIAVDEHTYSNFIELAKSLRIKLIPVPGDRSGMLPEELEACCRSTDVQGIFLMPSCCNPTAIFMPNERRRELASVIARHDLIVIEDDIHAALLQGTTAEDGLPVREMLPERTVYICSTTKSICSGIRLAYIVFDDTMRERMLRSIYHVNVKTSSLDAEIVSELIVSGRADDIVAYKKSLAKSANDLFAEYFPQPDDPGHPLSFFRWLRLPKPVHASRFESDLLARGVRVFHSDRFLVGTGSREQHLRVALSSTGSLDELRRGLEILRSSL
ncbi:aminotransferase-like domain-containing protein [Saccharibacillus alkalitolerans]|uniref:PLP-dependent aminotransferase family protein n=1 Tax=Saccharibacillus alkalitolerans TaxID=2705290 RepID=A0ABX0F8Z5_9BACL|nr:PLP-dependent aminotransferase family protein [Saccharibacillus alkalitolerans]NGZ77437.1 PLP-dependent aminotransferase family protein [Saccharibacillus alkalitolerans]